MDCLLVVDCFVVKDHGLMGKKGPPLDEERDQSSTLPVDQKIITKKDNRRRKKYDMVSRLNNRIRKQKRRIGKMKDLS